VIQFILNHDLVQLEDFQADQTLLDYLRLDKGLDKSIGKNLTGTKEGCASGDCGACTVVVAEPNNAIDALDYKSINSCICLLGSLHGKQVITVDSLQASYDGELHPVQQAMVDEHGSQCGFCTPGFVMSLFAMSKNKMKAERSEVVESIDGNLCRCTGYRPIIDAGVSVLSQSFTDDYDKDSQETLSVLNSIETANNEKSINENFFVPETIEELSQLIMQYPDAKLLAGGTDLVLDVTQGLQSLDKVIYVGQVKALKQISETDDAISIGAAVTYQECGERLAQEYPTLKNHLDRFASTQIRNVGTLGGNVANASPIGDMPPVLVALDCSLVLQKGAETRTVKIDDFYTGYKQTILGQGEFLRDILIPRIPRTPPNKPDHALSVHKISKRHADDISAICVAFYTQVENGKIISIRIGAGGMAATVKRATNCENFLVGQELNRETLEKAKIEIATDFEPMNDVRASREYRILMAQNLLERLFIELGAGL